MTYSLKELISGSWRTTQTGLSQAAAEHLVRLVQKMGGRAKAVPSKRKNPAGRKRSMTKKQRKLAAGVRAKKTRITKAVKGLLKQTNPAGKFAGAEIRRNKGSITIIPVRLPKRASR